jgi:hypothetical protein
MNSSTLRLDQLETLLRQAGECRAYLDRLAARMKEHNFPPNDAIFVAAIRAAESASHLCVALAQARNDKRPVMERKPWAG